MKEKDFYEKLYDQPPDSKQTSGFARVWKRLELNREQAVFQLLDKGDRFLDVGCGEGNLVFLAAQKFSEVYGIDIAAPRIHRAQERIPKSGRDRIHLQTANLNQGIPFADNYFDAASCVVTLEHVFNPIYLLQELYRVLKPGGILVIASVNIAYITRRLNAILGRPPRTSVFTGLTGLIDGGTLHYFTLSSLSSLIKQSGFRIIKKSNHGKLYFLRNWWLSLLASGLVIKGTKPK